MLSNLKATAVLGASSLISIVIGFVSVKAWALMVGPAGFGHMGLAQSLLGLSALLAGLGASTGIVKLGAEAHAAQDGRRFRALAWAGRGLVLAMGLVAAAVLAIFREPIGVTMLGHAGQGHRVLLLAPAVLFTLAAWLETGLVNARHRVGDLARLSIAGTAVGAAFGIAAVWWFGIDGIALSLLGGAASTWALAAWTGRERQGLEPRERPTVEELRQACRDLLRFGIPFTGSMLVGSAAQALLQLMVLSVLGGLQVGLLRAVVTLTERYLGVLLTAMGQDYYPRVSAAERDPEVLASLINAQFRLVLVVGTPLILGMMAIAHALVPLLYAAPFLPMVDLLEWQLAGNLFKFSSWTMAMAILAHGPGRLYFKVELTGAIASLACAWAGMKLFGLTGLGIGFTFSFAAYFAVVWATMARRYGFVLAADNRRALLMALGSAAVVLALLRDGPEPIRVAAALAIAGASALYGLAVIWREAEAAAPTNAATRALTRLRTAWRSR